MLVHRQRVNTPEDRCEAQPTAAWGGSGAVLFDGRLDDRAGLCEQLAITPRASLPDSELVARAFEAWGEAAVSRLVGDFALAAWDSRTHRVILGADKSGLRPLYFHRSRDKIVFSTVLPALLSVPGVPCDLDETIIADALFNVDRDTRQSYFRGIYRVMRATTVVLDPAGEKVEEYWRPEAQPPLILRRDEDYVDAAREMLDKTVACRLRSIEPVAVRASGGLDSACIIVSVLGQTDAPEVPVYTTVPETDLPTVFRPGKYSSERDAVLAMQAAFPRLSPRFVEPGPRPDIEFSPERMFEEAAVPVASVMSSGWSETTLRRMREDGANSCLGGHSGNVTLSWSGRFGLVSLVRQKRWLRLASEAGALSGYQPLRTARAIRHALRTSTAPTANRESHWRKRISLHPDAEVGLEMQERLRAVGDGRIVRARDGTEQRVQMATRCWASVGEAVGAARARHGLEVRDPTGDARMIEFCLSVPEAQYLHRGETRSLARRLLRAAGVPAVVTENTARGEWCPEWFARLERRRPDFTGEIARLRQSPMAARLLDLDRLDHLVAHWPESSENVGARRFELEMMFTKALHIGSFISWAESKAVAGYTAPQTDPVPASAA